MKCHNCECQLGWDGFSPIVVCDCCHSYRCVDIPDESGDRILSLERPGQSFCPCCRRRLTSAAMDGLKVEHCAECEGVLLTDDLFVLFVRNRRAEFRDAASQPVVLSSTRQQCQTHCPNCRREMVVHPCYGPNFIVVDSCAGCGMVWLDCRASMIPTGVTV